MDRIKTLLKKLRRATLKRWLEFKYRHQDPDVCCCGDDMYRGKSPWSCPATCRSLKEYVIECELEKRKC